MIGNFAGSSNIDGSNNVFIGYKAGNRNKGSNNIFIGREACSDQTSASNFFCLGGVNPLISANFSTQRVLITGSLVVTGDLYVKGTIYEGDDSSIADDFDEVNEIASGSSDSITASQEEGFDLANNGYEQKDSSSQDNVQDDVQDDSSNDFADSISDSALKDYIADSNNNSSSKSSTLESEPEYVDMSTFMSLSSEVTQLGNRINMLALNLEETQNQMREGFAMSSALAAMPTPTDYGLNFSAGAGNYDGANAIAIGFIYVHEDWVISLGHSKSDTGSKSMTNLGFTYNIGKLFKK